MEDIEHFQWHEKKEKLSTEEVSEDNQGYNIDESLEIMKFHEINTLVTRKMLTQDTPDCELPFDLSYEEEQIARISDSLLIMGR